MSDRSKKRHKDYKRIITMKTLDTSIYREGLPYLVKFNGDPKGKGIDNCDGRPGICIEASGGNLTFVFVSGTYVHEEYTHKVVSISCKYLDNSKIEIIPYWSDTEVLKLIDSVKHDPDKFHGYSYWNEEIQIYDQDNVEKVEETETENRVSKKDEILLKEIRQLVDGFEDKRFAITSLLATTIDIGCGIGEKDGEKKCVNCPLTSYVCREISNRAKMLLSDTCDEQTANEGNE